jgi:hypothetical protein
LPKLFAALVVLVLFWLAFRLTRVPLSGLLERTSLHHTLVNLLVGNLYRTVVLVFALVMAADQIGVNVGAALAGLGVVGIAVGFAAQDSIANVISGTMISLDKPFEVGDWITVVDQSGEVNGITMRSTRIRTKLNTYVVIPNKTIIDAVLVNHSQKGITRVDVPVGIAYKESSPTAREVMRTAVQSVEGVMTDPAPDMVVMEAAKLALDEAGSGNIEFAAGLNGVGRRVVQHGGGAEPGNRAARNLGRQFAGRDLAVIERRLQPHPGRLEPVPLHARRVDHSRPAWRRQRAVESTRYAEGPATPGRVRNPCGQCVEAVVQRRTRGPPATTRTPAARSRPSGASRSSSPMVRVAPSNARSTVDGSMAVCLPPQPTTVGRSRVRRPRALPSSESRRRRMGAIVTCSAWDSSSSSNLPRRSSTTPNCHDSLASGASAGSGPAGA